MGNPNQPMEGSNGSYDICGRCGNEFGSPPQGGIGVWAGKCDFCHRDGYLSNARHDWDISDEDAELIVILYRVRQTQLLEGVHAPEPTRYVLEQLKKEMES